MAGGSGVSTARSAIVRWIGENSATSTAPFGSSPFGSSPFGSSPFGSSASQAPANAERTHVRPHPLDVVEAGVLGAPGSLGPPATGGPHPPRPPGGQRRGLRVALLLRLLPPRAARIVGGGVGTPRRPPSFN